MTGQISYSRYYDSGRRASLNIADLSAWLSPADAEKMIAGLDLPMKPRKYLAFRAGVRSLVSKATIVEIYADGSGATHHLDIPLEDEWDQPAWSSPHADLWFDGTMRVTGRYSVLAIEYQSIMFERVGIENIIDRFSVDQKSQTSRNEVAGRPEKGATAYLGEMSRRASAGLLSSTVTDEAKALLRWYSIAHQHASQPQLKTVRQNISDEFKRLKTAPETIKSGLLKA